MDYSQTKLAFTLAKNATKPNSFEIIPLQTTRKENNWKTEETLVRAVVTLETERIKGIQSLMFMMMMMMMIGVMTRLTKFVSLYSCNNNTILKMVGIPAETCW